MDRRSGFASLLRIGFVHLPRLPDGNIQKARQQHFLNFFNSKTRRQSEGNQMFRAFIIGQWDYRLTDGYQGGSTASFKRLPRLGFLHLTHLSDENMQTAR